MSTFSPVEAIALQPKSRAKLSLASASLLGVPSLLLAADDCTSQSLELDEDVPLRQSSACSLLIVGFRTDCPMIIPREIFCPLLSPPLLVSDQLLVDGHDLAAANLRRNLGMSKGKSLKAVWPEGDLE